MLIHGNIANFAASQTDKTINVQIVKWPPC